VLRFRTRDAPEVIRSGFWKSSEVPRLHLLDSESSLLDKCGDIARHMAAFKSPLKERLRPFLPAPYADIRRESVFEKQELASRPQDAGNSPNGVRHSGNCAQREGANDGVNTGAWQRDLLSRQVKEFNVHLRLATLVLGQRHHPRIGFERIDFAHICRVVVSEVDPGTDATSRTVPCAKGTIC